MEGTQEKSSISSISSRKLKPISGIGKNKMILQEKSNTGITLIALVVTVVVLLILAGITINLIFSNGGIFDIANQSKIEFEIGVIKDRINNVIADWYIDRAVDKSVTIDDLWDKMKEENIIDDPETDVKGPEKEGENDVYEVTTNEGYIVEIIVSPDGNVTVGDIVKGDSLPPKIGKVISSSQSNSIHIEVEITRSEGEVKLSYYYKKEGKPDSSYQILKEEVTDLIADFTKLEQNVVYNIKIVVEDENGKAEKIINERTGELKNGTITQKGDTVWSNGTATIELETTEQGVNIQYQVGGTEGEWLDYEGPITGLHHEDTVYAVITDGINQSGNSSVNVLDAINPQNANIQLSETTTKEGKAITASVTHIDNESGVDITKCKWVYNTTAGTIGTEEASYIGGNFSSNSQTINLTAQIEGTYYLHVLTIDKAGNKTETISDEVTVEEKVVADGSFSKSKGVNTPNLANGKLTPVKWEGNTLQTTTPDDPEWYSYTTTDKKWANAQTADGSLWVWIPRYAYQINSLYNTQSTTGGEINIKFMKEATNEATDGTIAWDNTSGQGNWNIHPGFNYSSTAKGIWVAKFEASQSDAGVNAPNYENSTGGTSGIIKIQPGVNSWRNITIDAMYTKCLIYDTEVLKDAGLNSHLMKNTEWGAVAYLAQSEYGKNAEVWINANQIYITGQAGSGPDAVNTPYTLPYNSGNGPQASTTGNVYGVYDMSGGSAEYTASYVNNSNESLTTYGKSLVNGASYTKDVYTSNGDTETGDYLAAVSKYGDAVYETSANGNSINGSWYNDWSYIPYKNMPFFIRGGSHTDGNGTGLFQYTREYGNTREHIGFRPVLIVF